MDASNKFSHTFKNFSDHLVRYDLHKKDSRRIKLIKILVVDQNYIYYNRGNVLLILY